jgi:hypothetical protein
VAGIDLHGTGQLRRFSLSQHPSLLDETGPPVPSPSENNATLSETSLEGQLEAGMSQVGVGWFGDLDARLTSSSRGALNYGRLRLGAEIEEGPVSFRAGGALAAGAGSDGETIGSLTPFASIKLAPFDGLNLSGKITGGVRQNSIASVMKVNRYASLDGPFLPEDERLGYGISLHLEPWRSWGVRVDGSRQFFDQYLTFGPEYGGEFATSYTGAVIDRVTSDGYIRFDGQNDIALVVRYVSASTDEGDGLPYVPKWDGQLMYSRRLFNVPIELKGSIRYIGERSGATGELDPVALVGFEWIYSFGSTLDFVLDAENLFNQDYQIWEGYNERGLFVSLGARVRM